MRAGSNSKVDSKAPSKGRPRSKPSSKKWFGTLANRPHRLRNFLSYKEKNSEDTTNDEVHSWRRDRCGSHLFLCFVERTSEGEEDLSKSFSPLHFVRTPSPLLKKLVPAACMRVNVLIPGHTLTPVVEEAPPSKPPHLLPLPSASAPTDYS